MAASWREAEIYRILGNSESNAGENHHVAHGWDGRLQPNRLTDFGDYTPVTVTSYSLPLNAYMERNRHDDPE
jgi:hypothetical protein